MPKVDSSYDFFTDAGGDALEAGYIYIGEAGQNAESNPITVYSDKDYQYPLAQPIRTLAGLPSVSGSPVQIFTKLSQHSIVVRNKYGSLVRSNSLASSGESDSSAYVFSSIEDMANGLLVDGGSVTPSVGQKLSTLGRVTVNDGGQSDYVVTNDTPNGDDKIDLGGNLTATLLVSADLPNMDQWGVPSNGTDALNAINSILANGAPFRGQFGKNYTISGPIILDTTFQYYDGNFGSITAGSPFVSSGTDAQKSMVNVVERYAGLRRVLLYASSRATHGIHCTTNNANRMNFEDVYISSTIEDGVRVDGDTWMSTWTRVRVDSPGQDGFSWTSTSGHTTQVMTNCYCADAGRYGFHFENVLGLTMNGCAADQAEDFAFSFESTQGVFNGGDAEHSHRLFRVIGGLSAIAVRGFRATNYGNDSSPVDRVIDSYGTLDIQDSVFVNPQAFTVFAIIRDGSKFIWRNNNLNLNDLDITYENTGVQTTYVETDPMVMRRYISATQTDVTGDGTEYTLVFDEESYSEGFTSNNIVSNVPTVRVPGKYKIEFQVRLNDVSSAFVNGAAYIKLGSTTDSQVEIVDPGSISNSGDDCLFKGSCVAQVPSNGTINVSIIVSGSTLTVDVVAGETLSWLSIERVGNKYN